MNFERNWTAVGEAHTAGKRNEIGELLDRLVWKNLAILPTEGATAALAINALIRGFRIPRVDRYAVSNDLAPYGLVAVRGYFINGEGRVYALDEGHQLCVICSDFYPLESANSNTEGDSAHAAEHTVR